MKIQLATLTDIPVIQQIAYETWPIVYSEIISNEQLVYMLDLIYSDSALKAAINKKTQLFYIAKDDNDSVFGFFSVEHNYNNDAITKLHKIYILPENQGKGIGKNLINEIIKLSKEQKSETLILNVNRFNSAFYFYQKSGFEIIETVDIEIGNGYLMEDFVLELKI